MRELQRSLWCWEAPHPDWKPAADWGELVSSYAIDDGERLVLLDPLALPNRDAFRAGDRLPVAVANKGVPSEQILEGLRPLLELPVEHVLQTHGAAGRADLERALA